MRIAMLSEHASPLAVLGGVDAGGQNVHVGALATALADRGHTVHVYTRRDDPALPVVSALGPRVTVEHLDAGPARPLPKDSLWQFVPALAAGLHRRLAASRPDVLHAHFWMSGAAAVAAARAVDVPVVQTFHALGSVKRRWQGPADTSPPERVHVERSVATSVDRIIAACRDEVHELRSMGVQEHRVDVVPSGVDRELFTPTGPVAPRRPGMRRLLTVARLVPRKGVDDAIRMLPALPETELVVAGGPPAADLDRDPEARRLLALAAELGVAGRVQLRGRVDHTDLPALLRSADVAVCLPWYEPFGIVPLEAMACGVPVVGTAVGGLLDTVVDGVTGVLVPPRCPEEAAAAVAALVADEPRRRRYARAGRQRSAHYAWSRIAELTERCYESAADRTGLDLSVAVQR